MEKKDLRMIKSFHVTPQADADFEQLRREMCKRLGYRIGKSDFFCYMVQEMKQTSKANETITNH